MDLTPAHEHKVIDFIRSVSYYKLFPYIEYIKDNAGFLGQNLKKFNNSKDLWDLLVFLYRYNIRLSIAIYPYIYLLETTLKTEITNYLCRTINDDWYKDQILLADEPFIYKNACEYLKSMKKRNKTPKVWDFAENEVSFGYWTSIINSDLFFNQYNLKSIFLKDPKNNNPNTFSKKALNNKLLGIKELRNNISHHNKIIKKNIYKNDKLWDIFKNIENVFKYLGYSDLNWRLGDLHCSQEYSFKKRVVNRHNTSKTIVVRCRGNSFETLYKDFQVLHDLP